MKVVFFYQTLYFLENEAEIFLFRAYSYHPAAFSRGGTGHRERTADTGYTFFIPPYLSPF